MLDCFQRSRCLFQSFTVLLNPCSRLTTLLSQHLLQDSEGITQLFSTVLECGECGSLGLGSGMLYRTGLRASPWFSLFLPAHCDFCPRHLVPWKNFIFRSDPIILRGKVLSLQLYNWTRRMSLKHSECPQGGTTDYCLSGCRLLGAGVGGVIFVLFSLFLSVSSL